MRFFMRGAVPHHFTRRLALFVNFYLTKTAKLRNIDFTGKISAAASEQLKLSRWIPLLLQVVFFDIPALPPSYARVYTTRFSEHSLRQTGFNICVMKTGEETMTGRHAEFDRVSGSVLNTLCGRPARTPPQIFTSSRQDAPEI